MQKILIIASSLIIQLDAGAQQKVIQLYNGAAQGSESWNYNEQEYKPGTRDALIYNVSYPTLTMSLADFGTATGKAFENRPDFVAPVYDLFLPGLVADDALPLFLKVASDDNLELDSHSVDMYTKWLNAKKPVELHAYQKGSHGLGMQQPHIPRGTWIERFGDRLGLPGYIKSK